MIDWIDLEKRIQGRVIVPENALYNIVRKNFIARFDSILPLAVVFPESARDVSETIRFAKSQHIKLSVRSGGHCFAGFSLCDGIVLDLSQMKQVVVTDAIASVGAGCRIGDMNKELFSHGLVVPSGSCPSVGIGGTTLGGGLGVLGRKYGLTCDHLVKAEVVLADGTIVMCSESEHADLFWGIRGAGAGNFGVVTQFHFFTRPADNMTNFYLTWPFAYAQVILSHWQNWTTTLPDEMAAGLAFTATDRIEDPPFVELYGAMLATEPATSLYLDHFIERIGERPNKDVRRNLSYVNTQLFQEGLLTLTNSGVIEVASDGRLTRQGYRVTKSEFFSKPIPVEGEKALVEAFAKDRCAGQYRGLEFAPFGGAYNRVERDKTAFVHRDHLYSLKHAIIVAADSTDTLKASAHAWAELSWASVHRWGSGMVYPNFPDPEMPNPVPAYYGDNFLRLKRVKQIYDPDNFFQFPHSIQTRASV